MYEGLENVRDFYEESSSDEEDFEDVKKSEHNKDDPEVVMKMIDFAHSTFKGFMNDPIVHFGPDHGYLQGLDSLISILQKAILSTGWGHETFRQL